MEQMEPEWRAGQSDNLKKIGLPVLVFQGVDANYRRERNPLTPNQ